MDPSKVYQQRVSDFTEKHAAATASFHRISNMRLFFFILGVAGGVYLYFTGLKSLGIIFLVLALAVFLWLIKAHEVTKRKQDKLAQLIKINEQGGARLSGKWQNFAVDGASFLDESHPYSSDLDIFGKGSLYQLINTTNSYLGQRALVSLLTKPSLVKDDVVKRQKAVEELASKLDFRQELQAEGLVLKKHRDPRPLFQWVDTTLRIPGKNVLQILPAITLILSILAWQAVIPWGYALVLLGVQFILSLISGWRFSGEVEVANNYKATLSAYHFMFASIEAEGFSSRCLQKHRGLLIKEKKAASREIRKLARIQELLDIRYSMLYIVINTFTLWDYYCLFALDSWKKKNRESIAGWFTALAEIEALSSLAGLAFDNPDYALPKLTDHSAGIKTKDIGHPLINRPERIANDLQVNDPGSVLIITGSNMSGKSTLLRTVGINMVLAFAGCVVCAREFSCPLVPLHTSMRVKDNLDEGISSFYAELLRIQQIVERSKQTHLVFLIDEIFRGTNSKDRHIGAKTVISTLSKNCAMGLVSTHDLELGELASENPKISNYHFQESYSNGEIHFDYKLLPGISTTTNAQFLMRLVGIELGENFD